MAPAPTTAQPTAHLDIPTALETHPVVPELCAVLLGAGVIPRLGEDTSEDSSEIPPLSLSVTVEDPWRVVAASGHTWRFPEDETVFLRWLARGGETPLRPGGKPAHLAVVTVPGDHDDDRARLTLLRALAEAAGTRSGATLVVDAAGDRVLSQMLPVDYGSRPRLSWQTLLRSHPAGLTATDQHDILSGLLCAPTPFRLPVPGLRSVALSLLGWAPDPAEGTGATTRALDAALPVEQVLISADHLGVSTVTDCGTDIARAEHLAHAGAQLVVLNLGEDRDWAVTTLRRALQHPTRFLVCEPSRPLTRSTALTRAWALVSGAERVQIRHATSYSVLRLPARVSRSARSVLTPAQRARIHGLLAAARTERTS